MDFTTFFAPPPFLDAESATGVLLGSVWFGLNWICITYYEGIVYMYYHTKFGDSSFKNEGVMTVLVSSIWNNRSSSSRNVDNRVTSHFMTAGPKIRVKGIC